MIAYTLVGRYNVSTTFKGEDDMTELHLNFADIGGGIKPINAVNNGPTKQSVRGASNFEAYQALHIPYARNHDASFFTGYGGEHTVDVHRIFKNFDADENDPASYLFAPTDHYVSNTIAAGTKVFYRLGASIEHYHKYGTVPPKDYLKWARICEHIIRHYTEGWADGFFYDIEYWEIWNEPECGNADGSNPCWQGTEEEFIEFFCTALAYLKEKFPHLKIGGPAFTSPKVTPFKHALLTEVKKRGIPFDFYSFHGYIKSPEKVTLLAEIAQEHLKEVGLENVELHYNEWNYVRAWAGEEYIYSRKAAKETKGASLIAGAFAAAQASPLDMMMYYDARPSNWCGLFDTYTYACLKPYYTFRLFDKLAQLGQWVKTEHVVEDIYSCAATDGKESAVLLTHYNDDDSTTSKQVKLTFLNAKKSERVKVEYYLLDADHDGELVREEIFTADEFASYLNMKLFDTYLIVVKEA